MDDERAAYHEFVYWRDISHAARLVSPGCKAGESWKAARETGEYLLRLGALRGSAAQLWTGGLMVMRDELTRSGLRLLIAVDEVGE